MWERQAVLLAALAVLCVAAKRGRGMKMCADLEPVKPDVVAQLAGSWVTVERTRLPRGPVMSRRRNPSSRTCVAANVSLTEDGLSVVSSVHKPRRDVATHNTSYREREEGRWELLTNGTAVRSSEIMVLTADPTSYMVLVQCKQLRRTGVIEPELNVATSVTVYSRGGREDEEEPPRKKGRKRNKGKRKHWKGGRGWKKWYKKLHAKEQDSNESESSEGKRCTTSITVSEDGDGVEETVIKDCKELKKVSSEEEDEDSVEEVDRKHWKCKGRKKKRCNQDWKRKSHKKRKGRKHNHESSSEEHSEDDGKQYKGDKKHKGRKHHHDSSSEEHSESYGKRYKGDRKHGGKKWHKHSHEDTSVEIPESDEVFVGSNEDLDEGSNESESVNKTRVGKAGKKGTGKKELVDDGYETDDDESLEKSKKKSKKVRRSVYYDDDSIEYVETVPDQTVDIADIENDNVTIADDIEENNVTDDDPEMYKPLSKLQILEIRGIIKDMLNIDKFYPLMLSTSCYNQTPASEVTEAPDKVESGEVTNEVPPAIEGPGETSDLKPTEETAVASSIP